MDCPPERAEIILRVAESCLKSDESPQMRLKKLWWSLLLCRARDLTSTVRHLKGDRVLGGVFKGMTLTEESFVHYRSTLLMGSYEHELHPTIEKIIAKGYSRILNIGCSVGYYAVGLALRMPHVCVEAFDISDEARAACTKLAQLNGVQDRVQVSGLFEGERFAAYQDQKTLVVMDIEGAEVALLDPVRFPALQKMDILVELHDLFDPTIALTVCRRFQSGHDIEIIRNQNFLPDISTIVPPDTNFDPFDQLLLGWEGRDGATPWGMFWARS